MFVGFGFSHSFPLVTFPVTLKLYDRFGPEMHHSSHRSDSHHSHSEYDEVSIIESEHVLFRNSPQLLYNKRSC